MHKFVLTWKKLCVKVQFVIYKCNYTIKHLQTMPQSPEYSVCLCLNDKSLTRMSARITFLCFGNEVADGKKEIINAIT